MADGQRAERIISTGSPTRGLVSIILATFNEHDTILDTIRNIFKHVPDPVEIIVVDDDSPDQTGQLVESLRDKRVVLIRRRATRGLASAFMRGIVESRGDIVGWMDADMCMPPELLPVMIDRLAVCDIVIGSRYAPGGRDLRHPMRTAASRLINGLATLVLGYGIRDYDSGFVVLRRSVFDQVLPLPTGYGEYFIEFVYGCCKKGLRVCEVPYTFVDRATGLSKTASSLWRFFTLGMQYVVRIFRARLRRPD